MRNRYDHTHPADPYDSRDHRAGRVYVWETVPVDEQDCGANDEGYYWEWCNNCGRRTEHDGGCLECS